MMHKLIVLQVLFILPYCNLSINRFSSSFVSVILNVNDSSLVLSVSMTLLVTSSIQFTK